LHRQALQSDQELKGWATGKGLEHPGGHLWSFGAETSFLRRHLDC
jgi:hypothetical protein